MGKSGDPDLLAGYRRANDNMAEALAHLRDDNAHAAESAASWRESWERVIGELGELVHQAKARPVGRRFVTVLELQVLITRQGEHEGSA